MVKTKCNAKGDTGAAQNKMLKQFVYKENPGYCPKIQTGCYGCGVRNRRKKKQEGFS